MSAAPARDLHHVEYVDGSGPLVTWMNGTTTKLDAVPRQELQRISAYVCKADAHTASPVTKPEGGQWMSCTADQLGTYIRECILNAGSRRIGKAGTPGEALPIPTPSWSTPRPPEPVVLAPGPGNALVEAPTPVVETPAPVVETSAVDDLADALARLMPRQTIDEEQVRSIVKAELVDIVAPTRIVIHDATNKVTREIPGTVHKVTPAVIKALEAGVNVWLVGPAGTGKSTIGVKVSEALGLDFSAVSLSPTTPMSSIWGYMDAEGRYVETEVYRRYKDGGLLMFDEMDNGHPSILASVNMLLSNGHCAFPCGMVSKHESFRFIGTANTFGMGPDRQYVGRSQLDAATLDRFATIDVPVDEQLEDSVSLSVGADEVLTRKLITYVRALRASAEAKNVQAIFSPRASIDGARLLAAGFTFADVVSMRVRKGISDQDWARVADGVRP